MSYLTNLAKSAHVMIFAASGAIWATLPVENAFAKAGDPSTYQDSCTATDVAGATLTAVSRRRDGSLNARTSILIRGIENADGRLRYSRNPAAASTFQSSCENINAFGATLTAKCRRRDGSYNEKTSILIRGIDNANGKLTYSK